MHHFNRNELEQRVGEDNELLAELLGYAIEDFPMYIESLKEAATAGDIEGYSRAAHKMKGFARNMAFPVLADLCQTAEKDGSIKNIHLNNIDEEVRILQDLITEQQGLLKGDME